MVYEPEICLDDTSKYGHIKEEGFCAKKRDLQIGKGVENNVPIGDDKKL